MGLLRRLFTGADDPIEAALNKRLKGYPRNHNYSVRSGELVPSHKLRERWNVLSRMHPDPMPSFLDVGSCKGYFVLQAAAKGCPRTVGIDIHQPFIDVANDVALRLRLSGAKFHFTGLEQFAGQIGVFGGPFHTVQLISTYHYLFWGSDLESKSYRSHDAILEMFASVCSGQVIFANPLEIDNAPSQIQEQAKKHGVSGYTTADFETAARRLFDVRQEGYMDRQRKRPLYCLTKR